MALAAVYAVSPALAKAIVQAVSFGLRAMGGILTGDYWYLGGLAVLYVSESEWRRYRDRQAHRPGPPPLAAMQQHRAGALAAARWGRLAEGAHHKARKASVKALTAALQ